MKIAVPYNEILPTNKAHDVYLFNLCAHLASPNHTVELVCGKGTPSLERLSHHYHLQLPKNFSIEGLPILRKNNPFGLSWNRLFFANTQTFLVGSKPDIVHLSVIKQAAYHLKRRIKGIHYIYEAHELALFANRDISQEKEMMEKVDTIVVTTEAIKEMLLAPPYSIKTPIVVIPLAVNVTTLPPPKTDQPLTLGYIGQLYQGQGIETLLQALAKVPTWNLEVIGGKPEQVSEYQLLVQMLGLEKRVIFHGFTPPHDIPNIARGFHAFVASFGSSGRMPYVAHTKLYEYARFGRPVIAPDFPVTREHFPLEQGVLFYPPEDSDELAKKMAALTKKSTLNRLQKEILTYREAFTWKKRASDYEKIFFETRS